MSRAARLLWGLFVPVVLLAGMLELSGNATIARPLRRFFAAVQQTDSWRPMRIAEDYVDGNHDRPVYEEMLTVRNVKFQYPMSSLLFTRHLSLGWLNGLSWFSVIVVMVAIWWILRRTGTGTPLEFRHDDPAVGLALIGLTLSFYPVIEAYSLGQIQAWVTALLALAILAWVSGREDLAGVAVGLACLLKPTYGIFVIWAAVRRQTRFLVPLVGVVLLGTFAALVAYRWSDNVDYLTALRVMSRGGEAFYPNQSFNGFLNRLLGTANSLVFDRYAFAPYNPVVYAGTLIAFVSLVGLALWLPARRGAAGTALDFSILLLTITVTSPIAWVHHYGVVLPMLAATAPAILLGRPWGRLTAPMLALAYVALSQAFGPLDRAAGVLFGIPQSYVFAGALTILFLLYGSLGSRQPLPVPAAQPASGTASTP
jgi:alpha-1,2-mannosyltransferase